MVSFAFAFVARSYDWQALFDFNKTHGSTPLNFIPDEPVKAHLQKIATGQTVVWGAFDQVCMYVCVWHLSI